MQHTLRSGWFFDAQKLAPQHRCSHKWLNSVWEVYMQYQTGFGNHFETEALPNTLPLGQNSPKQPIQGLIPEQLSGSAFTMPRESNLRSWLYRIHPSTAHGPLSSYQQDTWLTRPQDQPSPAQMRWQPLPDPKASCDFIDGIKSMVVTLEKGGAVHHYHCNQSMQDRYFYNADGELVIIPERGELVIRTEMGELEVSPQEVAVVPRGVKFQVQLKNENQWSRGYLGENLGHPFILPNLGPLGANALAHPRDFLYPVAHFEDKRGECEVIVKFAHHFWSYMQDHSPLDVVAWHGNYAPYKYDLRRFNTMGTASYDHPDPSIYTVLTSPSMLPGMANLDFVIFPPRWLVAENTFRPPYYHRNIMSEYMGLIHGVYDAKLEGGFVPGGASLHNAMTPHGPDTTTFYQGIEGAELPQKISDTMAFMFESCHIFSPTEYAMTSSSRDLDYIQCWQGFKPLFKGDA
jgi:homogentisate 1,2-dioxygenase